MTLLYIFPKITLPRQLKTQAKTRHSRQFFSGQQLGDFLSLDLSWNIYIKVYVLLFYHILNKIKCFKNELLNELLKNLIFCVSARCVHDCFAAAILCDFYCLGFFFQCLESSEHFLPETEYPLIFSLVNTYKLYW